MLGWHFVVVWFLWRLYAVGWDGVNGFLVGVGNVRGGTGGICVWGSVYRGFSLSVVLIDDVAERVWACLE